MDKEKRSLLFMVLLGVASIVWAYELFIEFNYVLLGLLILTIALELSWAKNLKANH